MLQTIPSFAAWSLGEENTRDAAPTVDSQQEPDPGYVYLSVSRTMPGFVQVAHCQEDPTGLTWKLETFSGVTRFRNVCVVRTSDCRALEERFRQAVSTDQIPHHADLFKMPLRFARQILQEEAALLAPAAAEVEPASKLKVWASLAASIVALLALAAGMIQLDTPQKEKLVQRPQAIHAPAACPATAAPAPTPGALPMPKPRFRISKM